MRVALDVQSTLGQRTGIGTYTAQLLSAFQRLALPDLTVFPYHGTDLPMPTWRRLLWDQIQSPAAARRCSPNLLHVPGFSAPLRPPCPTILTVHDLIGALFPENLGPLSRFYWGRWLPRSLSWANRIIAISECTRRDILSLTRVPEERVVVIPHAAGDAYVPCGDQRALDAVLTRLGVRRPYILGVSSVEPRKNFPLLVEAYRRYRHGGKQADMRLVIVGKKTWGLAAVERSLGSAPGLADDVTLTGYVADEDLPALYQGAELFVFPSAYEGFGLPPLEAMACGTPVVASGVSSIPEVVGEAGRLVEAPLTAERFAQAMAEVLEDENARAEMSRKGLERAATFSWERTARETLEVYRRALSKT